MQHSRLYAYENDYINHDSFFEEYENTVFKIIVHFINSNGLFLSKDEIEDVYQEIALKIIKNNYINRHSANLGNINTWLGVITRTSTIDYLRKKQRWFRDLQSASEIEPAESNEVSLLIPKDILSQRQRTVLELSFREELTSKEIAAQLGISPQTVRCTKHQAIAKLRRHFKACR